MSTDTDAHLSRSLPGRLLARPRSPWITVGLGLLPYFWLTTSSYYYYVLRLTGVVIHAQDLSKTRNIVGLVLLFFMEVFTNATWQLNPGNRYFKISVLCILMTIYTFGMLGSLGYEWYKTRKPSIKSKRK